jgi:protein O-GlcNAc transferase
MIDYRLTDRIVDPPDSPQFFSEKNLYLDRCFLCYQMNPSDLDHRPIEADPDPTDPIVFAVLNSAQKRTDLAMRTWAQILQRVPNSKIALKNEPGTGDITQLATQLGIDQSRIRLINHVADRETYYMLFNYIDICLDTFPYAGTTTSCDTLMMSTPIVTLYRHGCHACNVTSSLLTNIGYPELVAKSIERYIQIAVSLAENRARINEYKQTIRSRFTTLMNPVKFVAQYDQLMAQLVETYRGQDGKTCESHRK